MNACWKKRWLRIWEKLVRFAEWCERHGIPKMLVDVILKIFLWWLTCK